MNNTNEQPEKLFSQFNPQNKAQWQARLTKDLKGATEHDLVWQAAEGFEVPPYVTAADLDGLDYLNSLHNTLLTEAGHGFTPRHWSNLAYIEVTSDATANAAALDALDNGANGLYFTWQQANTPTNLNVLLKDVLLPYIEVCFNTQWPGLGEALATYLANNQLAPAQLHGMRLAADVPTTGLAQHTEAVLAAASFAQPMPNFCGITINTTAFHTPSAPPVAELAQALSLAVHYLHHLTEAGYTVPQALQQIAFMVPVADHYLLQIAKLRVLRLLFCEIAHAYGHASYTLQQVPILATNSAATYSSADLETNIIKNTAQGMAAIVGGCRALLTLPHTLPTGQNNDFALRIARNISNILREEAHLDKVADPVAGAWYIESLTHQLAQQVWQAFQAAEQQGGFETTLNNAANA